MSSERSMAEQLKANEKVENNHSSPTLVVFCKRPKLHQGKQRLAASIGAENALHVARNLLYCAIEDTHDWPGPVVIACADEKDIEWAQSLHKNALVVSQMPTESLGERLNHIDKLLRSSGHSHLVFIGTDAPMLTPMHYKEVSAAIAQHDVVLSHADDGGVVIMANSVAWPDIANLPWSSEQLSCALAESCQHHQLSVHYVRPGYDVDYITDLNKLTIDLQQDLRPARQALLATILHLSTALGILNHA